MKQQLVREHDIEALIIDSRGRLSREAIAEAATLAAKDLARQATSCTGRSPTMSQQETEA